MTASSVHLSAASFYCDIMATKKTTIHVGRVIGQRLPTKPRRKAVRLAIGRTNNTWCSRKFYVDANLFPDEQKDRAIEAFWAEYHRLPERFRYGVAFVTPLE